MQDSGRDDAVVRVGELMAASCSKANSRLLQHTPGRPQQQQRQHHHQDSWAATKLQAPRHLYGEREKRIRKETYHKMLQKR